MRVWIARRQSKKYLLRYTISGAIKARSIINMAFGSIAPAPATNLQGSCTAGQNTSCAPNDHCVSKLHFWKMLYYGIVCLTDIILMRIYLHYVLHTTVTLSCIHTHSLYCLIISYCDIYNQYNKYKVPSAGNDGVSSLIWSSKANHLVSTNWDGGVRCWEVQESGQQVRALPKAQGELFVLL